MTALVAAVGLTMKGRLDPTTLELHAGQLTCLIGPNGSGKTSLLQAFAGLPPAQGSIRIDGQNPHRLHADQRQRLLSFLPATRDIAWPVRARDLVTLNLPPGTDWESAARALAVDSLLERRVNNLSTGERTRVLVARALAPDPKLLLLDEPTANLDPYWQLSLMAQLRDFARNRAKAILVTIHDLALAQLFADRLILMSQGAIAADGDARNVASSATLAEVFGVKWNGSRWDVSPAAGRQSSR